VVERSPLQNVLAAVASAVRESVAPRSSAGALDGVLQDAGQYGVEACVAGVRPACGRVRP
jgi:hypothetical protein